MELLVLGMVIFMAVHLTPSFVNLRRKLIGWRGETVYMIGYSGSSWTGPLCGDSTTAPVSFRCSRNTLNKSALNDTADWITGWFYTGDRFLN
jgi:hypothetical protein